MTVTVGSQCLVVTMVCESRQAGHERVEFKRPACLQGLMGPQVQYLTMEAPVGTWNVGDVIEVAVPVKEAADV